MARRVLSEALEHWADLTADVGYYRCAPRAGTGIIVCKHTRLSAWDGSYTRIRELHVAYVSKDSAKDLAAAHCDTSCTSQSAQWA